MGGLSRRRRQAGLARSSASAASFHQKLRDLRGELRADSCRGGDLLGTGFAQTRDAAKRAQQKLLAVLGNTRAIVENALRDPSFHEELMIRVRETVRFVADALEQPQRAAFGGEDKRLRPIG